MRSPGWVLPSNVYMLDSHVIPVLGGEIVRVQIWPQWLKVPAKWVQNKDRTPSVWLMRCYWVLVILRWKFIVGKVTSCRLKLHMRPDLWNLMERSLPQSRVDHFWRTLGEKVSTLEVFQAVRPWDIWERIDLRWIKKATLRKNQSTGNGFNNRHVGVG